MVDFGLSKDSLRNIVNLAGQFVGTTDTLTLTNKTISISSNTVTATSGALGDLIAHDGTSYVRKAKGTANQAYVTNSGATDTGWGTVAVQGGGTGVATFSAGVVTSPGGTTALSIKANPTGAFLGDSDTQNVTGAKTYTNTAFLQRNPAGTFSLTWVHPAITAAKDRRAYQPYNYLVYSEGGTWYAKNGLTEAIDSSSATAATVIQFALDNLTAARTQKEVVKIIGSASITTLNIPSYTVLDLTAAKLTQTNSANINMLINSDTSGGNTQIEIFGGHIDGNKAGQGSTVNYSIRNAIALWKVTDSTIRNMYIINANQNGIFLGGCTNINIPSNSIVTPRRSGILAHIDGPALPSQYLYIRDNYIENPVENPIGTYPATDVWVEANVCNGNSGVSSGVNLNGSRIHSNWNYIKDIQTIGLGIAIEGAYTADENEVCFNYVDGSGINSSTAAGGISINAGHVSDRIMCIGNKVRGSSSGQTSTAIGLRFSAAENSICSSNLVWNWKGSGIKTSSATSSDVDARVFRSHKMIISNNICWDNGKGSDANARNRAGISLEGPASYTLNNMQGTNVFGNHCYDNGGGLQLYGIYARNTDETWIHGNDVRGNITNGILLENTNANISIHRNKGYVTENSGTATVTTAATTSVVTHGLAVTPSLNDIKITPTNSMGTATKYFISTPTSTQFTINVDQVPGATTATFVWEYRAV